MPTMELKAYDPLVLLASLKGKGLDVAEDGVKLLIEETLTWVEQSAKLSATPLDDIAMILLPRLKAMALGEADKIDGKVG